VVDQQICAQPLESRLNRRISLHILPDQLQPGLRLIICGTAVGAASAKRGAYYAGSGNKFWSTLHAIGLTTRELLPEEYVLLSREGIGLTDLAKGVSGADADLPSVCFDAPRLRLKIKELQPRALAFNGKRAAAEFFGVPTRNLIYGVQSERLGQTVLYVLPSTSGATRRYWSLDPWRALAIDLDS
jgi:double-stranded uracil-DNA glycosylase